MSYSRRIAWRGRRRRRGTLTWICRGIASRRGRVSWSRRVAWSRGRVGGWRWCQRDIHATATDAACHVGCETLVGIAIAVTSTIAALRVPFTIVSGTINIVPALGAVSALAIRCRRVHTAIGQVTSVDSTRIAVVAVSIDGTFGDAGPVLRHDDPYIVDVFGIVGLADGARSGTRTSRVGALVGASFNCVCVSRVTELRYTAAGPDILIVVALPSCTTVRKDASPGTGGFAEAVVLARWTSTITCLFRALVVITTEVVGYLVGESILTDAAPVDEIICEEIYL